MVDYNPYKIRISKDGWERHTIPIFSLKTDNLSTVVQSIHNSLDSYYEEKVIFHTVFENAKFIWRHNYYEISQTLQMPEDTNNCSETVKQYQLGDKIGGG